MTSPLPPADPTKATAPTHKTTIILNVPVNAEVWINGKTTKSTGTKRSYIAYCHAGPLRYSYDVVIRNGEQVASRRVVLAPDETSEYTLNPSAPMGHLVKN
jgi:hypothetical protein